MFQCIKIRITLKLESGSYVQNKEEWILNTSGINLLDIWNSLNVDFTRNTFK